MRRLARTRRYCLYLLMMLELFFGALFARADETEGLEEPDVDYDSFIEAIHIGQTHVWKPFAGYPDLPVTYLSSDPETAEIAEDGTITPFAEGAVTVTASTPRTDTLDAGEAEMYFYILSEENGLYLTDMTCHFYFMNEQYQPGELARGIESDLCLTQPDLKKYILDYLSPDQSKYYDPEEAVLTAILNFGDQYFSKNSLFDGYTSNCESGKTDWMQLLRRKEGMCAYNASLFCYLMYLGELPAMQVDSPVTQKRGHSWNLIEHDGYYYNLEEYDFLHEPKERYVIPPLSGKTAAYFPGHIVEAYAVHFPKEGVLDDTMKLEDLGRDLSEVCPVLMYERGEDGTYQVRFEEIRKGNIPAWADGTDLTLEEITYKNMETNMADGQYNKEAKPLFDEANRLLWDEIGPLMEG